MLFYASRRRHTRNWRDWSSDVSSTDLARRYEFCYVLVKEYFTSKRSDYLNAVFSRKTEYNLQANVYITFFYHMDKLMQIKIKQKHSNIPHTRAC